MLQMTYLRNPRDTSLTQIKLLGTSTASYVDRCLFRLGTLIAVPSDQGNVQEIGFRRVEL